MTDENVNEEMQDEAATEPAAETTDAPDGRADAENLPMEQVPEGDIPGSADETPEASAAETTDAESTEEPAEGSPVEDTGEPTLEPVEQSASAAESTEEPAEGSVDVVEEPGAAESPAGDAQTPVGTAAAPETPPKKKKRLPRSLRPQRTKVRRERSSERKPITRLPKPEHERGRRQERQGKVVSANADKTIIVRVDVVKVHPRYKKVVKRSTKLHAHDEANQAKVGDVVRLVETRPLSKLKRWRLQEIVEEAK